MHLLGGDVMEAVGTVSTRAYVAPETTVLRSRALLAIVLAVFVAQMALAIPGRPRRAGPGAAAQATSNRSRSITLDQAATKSRTNFSLASSLP
jgi:hypothetical protein